jgi:hypothetical protein
MIKIGRNDPCPCGSGKKFKKCHMGREDELALDGMGEISVEKSAMITSLPEVSYGRSREMAGALDIQELTGSRTGIRFVDLREYSDLNIFGSIHPKASEGKSGGVFINLYKTQPTDPHNVYLALSPDIDDSTLIHELAHVLDYLGGSKLMPGALEPFGLELNLPREHLEHPEEYGYWLNHLKQKFDVQLDADDSIILYLYQNGMLINGSEIQAGNRLVLRSKSDRIMRFLSSRSQEIDTLIRNLPGYIGPRNARDN